MLDPKAPVMKPVWAPSGGLKLGTEIPNTFCDLMPEMDGAPGALVKETSCLPLPVHLLQPVVTLERLRAAVCLGQRYRRPATAEGKSEADYLVAFADRIRLVLLIQGKDPWHNFSVLTVTAAID
jgi:hypothetical protein